MNDVDLSAVISEIAEIRKLLKPLVREA